MKNFDGCVRGFHHFGAAWYGRSAMQYGEDLDRVMIGMYHREGGTSGEFSIVWTHLSSKTTPQLKSFDDSWAAPAAFSDVLAKLAEVNGLDITPMQLCEILKECGLQDLTAYTQ